MSEPNPKLDRHFNAGKPWAAELSLLREMLLRFPLREEMKWGQPCYTLEGKNVVVVHGFKEYCGLLFFKGVLMNDPDGLLIQQTENVQAGRQIRLTDSTQIKKLLPKLKKYVQQAIDVEKSGAKVPQKTTAEFKVVEEFAAKLKENAKLKAAFEGLTPGRQRAYLLFFAGAKQAKTREARVKKCTTAILKGKGMDD